MNPSALLCPCGASAPADLPSAGRAPVRCTQCGTPLVQPGGVPRDDAERGLGAALLVASLLAVAWMFAARWTDGSARWAIPVGALVIGLAAWSAARARGPAVQSAAVTSFAAFVLLGEVLLYRGALLTRLVALHAAEGAENPEVLAVTELGDTGFAEYLHVELTFWLFVAVAAGVFLALRVTRAPTAVEAFLAPLRSLRAPAADTAPSDEGAHDEEPADEEAH